MCGPSPLQHLILKHEIKSAVGAKSGRLHAISQCLRERRSIGSSHRTSNWLVPRTRRLRLIALVPLGCAPYIACK